MFFNINMNIYIKVSKWSRKLNVAKYLVTTMQHNKKYLLIDFTMTRLCIQYILLSVMHHFLQTLLCLKGKERNCIVFLWKLTEQ